MKLFGRTGGGDPRADAQEVFLGLRRLALDLTPGKLGAGNGDGAPILATLMETGYPTAVATLVGAVDGTTSLYFSNGGGVIGAGARGQVAHATEHWIATCGALLAQLPAQFVAVTAGGLRSATLPTAELGPGHPLAALYLAAHGVITQIRLTEAA
jgi:hypothetical protein